MQPFNALMPGEHDWMKGKPMPGQAPQPAVQPKRNPVMNALSTVFEYGAPEAYEAGRQKKITRELGNRLAGGDVAGAGQYALQQGNLDQGMQLQGMATEQDAARRKQEAQGVVTLFSQGPQFVNQYAMEDPAGFEQQTGMTADEYLQAAGRFGDGGQQFAQFAMQKAQAELGQMPAAPEAYTLAPGARRYGADGREIAANPVTEKAPGYENITLADGEYEYIPGQPETLRKLGDSPVKTPLVSVNTGDGPQDTAFMKEAGSIEARNFGSLVEMGQTARRNRVILDQLDTGAAAIPGGLEAVAKNYLGNLGISTDGLSEIQATEALINQLVPAQRAPGSGPMSDRDLALFKASLPRLIQTAEGKTRILTNMKAINDYVISEGEIGSRVLSGQLTPEQGRAQMQALGNPLAGDPRTGTASGPQGADLQGLMAPDGDPVTEEDVAETMRKYNVTREQVIAHLRGQ
jgi:hypothetical protein